MNADKNLEKGKLARDLNQLRIQDLVKERTRQKGPETHLKEENQIDGILDTKYIACHTERFITLWSGT